MHNFPRRRFKGTKIEAYNCGGAYWNFHLASFLLEIKLPTELALELLEVEMTDAMTDAGVPGTSIISKSSPSSSTSSSSEDEEADQDGEGVRGTEVGL